VQEGDGSREQGQGAGSREQGAACLVQCDRCIVDVKNIRTSQSPFEENSPVDIYRKTVHR